MKNKIYIIIVFFVLFFKSLIVFADDFNFDVTKIEVYENGNLIKGLNGGKVTTSTNLEIVANYFEYDKTTTLMKAFGNAILIDTNKDIIIRAEKIFYLKNKEKIYTKGKTFFNIENKYEGDSADVLYFRNTMVASSNKKTFIKDNMSNFYYLDSFVYNVNKEILNGESVKITDKEKDNYSFSKAIIDLKTGKLLGQDITIDFKKEKFGNDDNEPRIKGVTANSDSNKTVIRKGLFTTCKRNGEKCPPWVVKADKITHDKTKKTVYYKNAWLKLYDVPVWYYPYFFHPDPSVKRQSGFLKASSSNNTATGHHISLPYFFVVSEDKDLTFKPYIFTNKKIVLQNEYRQISEKSITIADFSYSKGHYSDYKDSNTTKSHFFSNTKIDLELENFISSDLEINLQKISNDTYLTLFDLKSPLFETPSTLTSNISLILDNDNTSFDISLNQYEKLSGRNQDRYTYALPNYSLSKSINMFDNLMGSLNFTSTGHNKLFDTNISETNIINNLNYVSENLFSNQGIMSGYKILLKNVNTSGKNSLQYNSNLSSDVMSAFLLETSLPLVKNETVNEKILTPKMSFRYSPNNTKKGITANRINIGNIYNLNRLGQADSVETGASMTLGLNYQKTNKINNEKKLEINIASNFRNKSESDIPGNTTINRKTSDLIGEIRYQPNDILNVGYNFSLDNDMSTLNYNYFDGVLQTNNLKTHITYSEESELFGDGNFIAADFKYDFNNDTFLTFSTRRNRKISLTEFYNLVWDYKNDCLIASIDYKKTYYQDRDIKPTENLFFQITIVPLTSYMSPDLVKKSKKLNKINPSKW